MSFVYDRPTTKRIYGIPNIHEYGRWNGTFGSGVTSWRRFAQQRITQGDRNTTRILVVGCGLGLLVEGLRAEGWQRVWGINLNDYFGSLWDQATCPTMTEGTGTPSVGGYYVDPTTKAQTPISFGAQWPCEVNGTLRPLLGKYDLRTMTTANIGTLTALSGGQRAFDVIVTEDVCTNYTLAELQAPATASPPGIYASCDRLLAAGGQVRHLVTQNWDPGYWLNGTWTVLNAAPPMDLAQWTATLGGRANHLFQDVAGVADTLSQPI